MPAERRGRVRVETDSEPSSYAERLRAGASQRKNGGLTSRRHATRWRRMRSRPRRSCRYSPRGGEHTPCFLSSRDGTDRSLSLLGLKWRQLRLRRFLSDGQGRRGFYIWPDACAASSIATAQASAAAATSEMQGMVYSRWTPITAFPRVQPIETKPAVSLPLRTAQLSSPTSTSTGCPPDVSRRTRERAYAPLRKPHGRPRTSCRCSRTTTPAFPCPASGSRHFSPSPARVNSYQERSGDIALEIRLSKRDRP